jgi:subtilase family serine protease/Tol biopolymer transport system component/fibronectin type 3 domain-containing protein
MGCLFNRVFPVLAKAVLWALAVQVSGSAWASSPEPVSPFPITGAYSAVHRADWDHISIIELSGNYDKLLSDGTVNVEPRAIVAQEFLRTHPDNYDFIVVFSTFEFDTGDALAFHHRLQNAVQGINLPIYDNSSLFGSAGKLKGYTDMAALTRYETNPLNTGFDFTISVLAHEVLHQWGPSVRFMQEDDALSDALIGHQGAHWSYLLDSDASLEYGADWKDNGDGTFTSVGVRRFFSPLDLYLMGYYKPGEVPPFYLIENPDIDKTGLPEENVTIRGTKRELTIDDIIAAEGPRIPSAGEAQHDYRFAFVLLAGQDETVTEEQILALNNIRKEFMTRYAILTGGRGIAQVYPEALPTETTGTPDEVTGGTIRTSTAILEDGLAWLRDQQQGDGSWSDKEATSFRDTAVVLDTLSRFDSVFTGELNALTWLDGMSVDPNADFLARYAALRGKLGMNNQVQLAQLVERQNQDGGWGLGDGYGSTSLDTALALEALASADTTHTTAIDRAVDFLVAQQNPDGGWSGADTGPSHTSVTVTVLQALKAAQRESTVDMASSLAWVAGKQNLDNGFGDSPSTVHDTASVLNAMIILEATDQIRASEAVDYLMTSQTEDGSWAGSAYATALAISSLRRFNYPNWSVDPIIAATPETPRDGDRVEVCVTVHNDSNLATPAGTLQLFDGDPEMDGEQIGEDMALPLLAPNQSVELTRLWDSYDREGDHTLVALVDPDDLEIEMSERDNRAELAITVTAPPAGIDLALEVTDISVSPTQPDVLPTTLSISASVRNLGVTDASNAVIQVWDDKPDEGQLVGENTLTILGRSSVAVNHTYTLTTPGTSTFYVVLDPQNQLLEDDESNNSASASITTAPTIDLAVSTEDISISDNPAYVGDDITFMVAIHNQGTLDTPSANVLFQVTDGSTTQEIQTASVQVDAGQSVTHNVIWRVDMEGDLVFSALLDTDNLVPELNEENNSATAELSAGLASGPNLAVDHEALTFAPTPALEGYELQLSAEVGNTGADSASDIEVAFYDGDPQQGGTQIGTTQLITDLSSGESTTVSVLMPSLADSQDRLLFVVVDPQDLITEFYEEDNTAFNTVTVQSLPDLATSTGDMTLSPVFPKVGDDVTLTVRVSNLGQQAADEVVVRAYDGDPNSGGVLIGTDQTIASLPGLAADTVEFNWTLDAASSARPVVVQIDPAGAILERITTNNTASRQVAVQDGDFYVTEPYISPDGDGVKESTQFFFRLQSVATVSVAVVNTMQETVRTLTSEEFQDTIGGNVLWDGMDSLGRLVEDGVYHLRVVDENDLVLGQARVSVDTNHSPILDSIGTPYQSFSNLTCDIERAKLIKVTEDENTVVFYKYDDPAGIYRMSSNGADTKPIITQDYLDGDQFYDIHASNDGETVIFKRSNSNFKQTLYVINSTDGFLRTITLPDASWHSLLDLSHDGSTAYTYTTDGLFAIPTDGVSAAVNLYPLQGENLNEFKQSSSGRYISAKLGYWDDGGIIIVDTLTNSTALIQTDSRYYSWSPDEQRIAITNYSQWRMDIHTPQGVLLQSIDIPLTDDDSSYARFREPQWSLNSSRFASSITKCASPEDMQPGVIAVFDTTTNSSEIVAEVKPIPRCGEYSYHVSTWDGSEWVERGVLHYDLHYRKQKLSLDNYLPDPDGEYKVRIRQTGLEAAHVDHVALEAGGLVFNAASATDTGSGNDLLTQVVNADHEVQDLHESEMEVHWKGVPPANATLVLVAREEQLSNRNAIPFSYPENSNHNYSYTLDGSGSYKIDGMVTGEDRLSAPLFDVFSKPGTGHPPARVYGYLSSDDSYLYGALDFTVDNTIDGEKDWASLWARTASGWREFRVTASDTQWGVAGFTHTGKVRYRHKYYEFKIPLNELGASLGDTLDVRFQAYGTAAILVEESSHYLPPFGDLLWAPGDESLVYETYNSGSWAIRLKNDNLVQELFSDWSYTPTDLRFVPSGRQLLFSSGEEANNPESVCYGIGTTDSWSFKSLLNLTADLRAIRSSQTGGVKLMGSATDLNFDSYVLEYAFVDSPDAWLPIAPASGQPLVDDQFTTWVPPGPGAYFVQLTVNDKAGNQRRFITRVYWSDSPSITDLYRTPRDISPNGDGTQDEALIHYRVLQPVHLEFQIYNASGDLVRKIARDHSLIGAEFDLSWDGRDNNGFVVQDGDYRLVVQNYEFAISVDTTAPSLTLIKNNAYQSKRDPETNIRYVVSDPILTWSFIEANWNDILLEKSKDFSTELESDPVNRGRSKVDGDKVEGKIGLSLSDLVNKQFRFQVSDKAGNRTIVYSNDTEEEVFVREVGDHTVNPRIAECIDDSQLVLPVFDSDLQRCIANIGGYYKTLSSVVYAPLDDPEGSSTVSANVSDGDIRFLVYETTQSKIVQAYIQYRLVTDADWSEEPALGYIDLPTAWNSNKPATEISAPKDGIAHIIWRPEGLLGGMGYVARLRTLDVLGNERFSNAFSFRTWGFSFKGLVGSASEAVYTQEIKPYLPEDMDPHNEWYLWGKQLLGNRAATIDLYVKSDEDPRYAIPKKLATVDHPKEVFIFRTKELDACKEYSGFIVVKGEKKLNGTADELGRTKGYEFTTPCLELDAEVVTEFAPSCGDPSPNHLSVKMTPWQLTEDFTSGGSGLKLLTLFSLDEAGEEDIVFNVNLPESGRDYHYDIDTSDKAEGNTDFYARLVNDTDDELTIPVEVIIDHTPPTIDITYPLEGEKVCGNMVTNIYGDLFNTVIIEGTAFDANNFHYEVDIDSELKHMSRLSSHKAILNSFYLEKEYRPKTPSPEFHMGPNLAGPIAQVVNQHGTVEARFRVFDHGGFQQCMTRKFEIDGEAELYKFFVSQKVFSPNGDTVRDSVDINYTVGEAGSVDILVYKGAYVNYLVGDGADEFETWSMLEKTGKPLKTLSSGDLALPGTAAVTWDGTNDSGIVVEDGMYVAEIIFRDGCDIAQSVSVNLQVDNTPPEVSVAYPNTGDPIPMLVEVNGTVGDKNLVSYVVSFGVGHSPDEWSVIQSGSVAKIDDILARWNTYGLLDEYTLRVTAVDKAGNTSEFTVPLDITDRTDLIQYLEAEPSLFSPNSNGRRDTTSILIGLGADVELTVSVLSESQVIRTLSDNLATSKGSTVLTWDGRNDSGDMVPDGTYLLEVAAASAANSLLTQQERITLVVDTSAPQVELLRPSNGFVNTTGYLVGNISDNHLKSYRIDLLNRETDDGWQEIDIGTTSRLDYKFGQLSELEEGQYTLRIQAEDEGENQTNISFNFIIDETPPQVVLDPLENSLLGTKNGPYAITGSVIEDYIDHYTLRYGAGSEPDSWLELATGTILPLADPIVNWDVSGLSDGSYTLELLAVDKAGQQTSQTLLVVVDNTPPEVEIDNPAEGSFISQATDILGTIYDDNLANYQVDIAPGPKGASERWSLLGKHESSIQNSTVWNWQALPPDGLYTFRIMATDQADNAAVVMREYIVDTTPPAVPTGLTAELVDGNDVHLGWNANTESDLIGYYLYRDNARITEDPVSLLSHIDQDVVEGRHQYTITAIDQAGLESDHSDTLDIVIDLSPPKTKLTVPTDSAVVKGYLDIEGTAYSADDFKEYRLYVGQGTNPTDWQLLRQSPVATIADVLAQWNTVVLPEGAQYSIRLEAEDITGNLAQHQIVTTIDNLPPAAPTGLTATPAGSDATLDWTANTESDLLGYLVFRDDHLVNAKGVAVGDLRPYAITGTTYTDSELPDGSYVYTVIAIDQAGNLSDASESASIDLDTRAPHAIIVTPEENEAFNSSLYIMAESEDNDVESMLFQYRTQGASVWIDLASADTSAPYETHLDPDALGIEYGTYEIQAVATDTGGSTDSSPTPVTIIYKDLTRPASVLGLYAVTDGGSVTLTWDANTESDLDGYHIERSSSSDTPAVRLTVDPITATTYVDTGLADGQYEYCIVAVDSSENEADPSGSVDVEVFTPALDQPFTPISTGLSDFTGVANTTSNVTADAELINDLGTTDLESVTTDSEGAFLFEAVTLATGVNTLQVTMSDDDGNRSKPATVIVVNGEAPSIPTGVTSFATEFDIDLTWNENPETNIAGYRVFRDAQPVFAETTAQRSAAEASSSAYRVYASYAIDGRSTTYWSPSYTLGSTLSGEWLSVNLDSQRQVSGVQISWQSINYRAVDYDIQAWNADIASWITVAEVLDNQDLENLIVLSTPYQTDQLRLVIKSINFPDYYYRAVRLSELAVLHQPLATDTQIQDTVPDGIHDYTVTAVNTLGFESAASEPAEVAVGDVVAPDPVTLTASVDAADVTLEWSASASSDTDHYLIYRNGELIYTHIDLTSLQYIDSGLANGSYEYTVTVVDGVGNESEPSNIAQATISEMIPATPIGLVIVEVAQGRALDLMWSQGTGGSATNHYLVKRSETSGGPYTAVATTTDSNYRDTGLTNGTRYYYVINAVDLVGNQSTASEEDSGVPNDTLAPSAWLHSPTIPGRLYTTIEPSITINGLSEPGATIAITSNGSTIGTTTASIDHAENVYDISPNSDNISLSPNGRYLAYKDSSYNIVIYDLQTQSQLEVPVTYSYANHFLTWAADGRSLIFTDRLTYGGQYYARQYDLDSLQVIDLTDPADSDLSTIQISPSGQQIAGFGEKDGQSGLWLVDIDNSAWTLLVTESIWNFDQASLRWSPDGSRLSYLRTAPSLSVEIVYISSGTQQVVSTEAGSSIPKWSPDGSELLYVSVVSGTPQVWHYTVADGQSDAITGNGQHLYPSWDPSGQRIAYYASDDNDKWSIVIRDLASDVETLIEGATQGTDSYPLQWTQSGAIGLYTDGEYRTLVPAGHFEVIDVKLANGDNFFYAEANDESGNSSTSTEPMTVNFDLGAIVDLAIADTDVRILPAAPNVGEPVRVTAIVRNPSDVVSPAAQLTFVVVDPTGNMTTLLDGTVIDPIQPSASQAVSADWLVSDGTGLYTLVVTVDAEDAVLESSEANNTVFTDFLVSPGGDIAAEIALTTDRNVLNSNQVLSIDANVTNGGAPFSGEVTIRIEDLNGYVVETLVNETVNGLVYGATQNIVAEWEPATTFSGDYIAHAILMNATDNIVHDTLVPFRLLGNSELSVGVTTDLVSYAPNTPVYVMGSYQYVTGNSSLDDVSATLQLLDTQGLVVAQEQFSLGTLLPENQGNLALFWNCGTSPAGEYTAQIELTQDSYTLAQAQSTLTVELGDAQLRGEISVIDAAIGSGALQTANYTVSNISNILLTDQALIISLYDPDLQSILSSERVTASIPVADVFSGSVQLATEGLLLKDYTVLLQAEVPDNDGQIRAVTLQTTQFKIVDRTPPVVRIDVPMDDGFLNDQTALTVFARDDLSRVQKVEAIVDDGAWKTLSALDSASGTWGEVLIGLSDGVHTVMARATDSVGNVAETALVSLTLDTVLPEISVSGIEEWAHYNVDVIPVITVTDENSVDTLISLNGIEFESGTTVTAEDNYLLAVQATDAAGNRSYYELEFEIDKTPPVVEVTAPVDGEVSSDPTTDVVGTTEPYSIVYLQAGDYQVSQLTAEDGAFLFEAVPMIMGSNTISLHAEDRADNVGSTAEVHVTREPEIQATLEGAIVPTGDVLIWYPAKFKGLNPNDDDDDQDDGYGENDNEDESSGDLCKELGVTDKRNRSIGVKDDWKSHHHQDLTTDPLLTMVETTLQAQETNYHIAHDERDFVEKLRTHRYSTVLFIDLMHMPIWPGDHEWHYRAQWPLHEHAQEELLGTIASGTGLLWIKTHPGHGHALAHGLGMRIFGTSPHLGSIKLPYGPASDAGTWEASGFALNMRTKPGTAVGEIHPSNRPAMMLSRHGNGNIAVLAFNPALLTNQDEAKQILERSLAFARPIEVPVISGIPIGIRWTAQQLIPPMNLEFVEEIPLDMSFLNTINGVIESDQVVRWQSTVDTEQIDYNAIATLPDSLGTYNVKGTLSELRDGLAWELVNSTLDLHVTTQGEDIAVDLIDALNALDLHRHEARKRSAALWFIQLAIGKEPSSLRNIEFSLRKLLIAQKFISAIHDVDQDIHRLFGQLLSVYQLAWVEHQALATADDVSLNIDRSDMSCWTNAAIAAERGSGSLYLN